MKLFYTTDEVAQHLEVAPSKVRYYVQEFGLKIQKTAQKRRYAAKDIDQLAEILRLVEKENYTLQGAKDYLKAKPQKDKKKEQIISRLEGIKELLIKLHGSYEG